MISSKYFICKMKRIKLLRSIFLIGLITIGIVTNIVLHEYGHTLPPVLKGGSIERIVVLGYEIVPKFGAKTHFGYGASFNVVNWPNGVHPTEFWFGLHKFSAAGFTLFMSLVSVILLWTTKPKLIVRYILLVLSFGFLDMLTYTFLPLFGLPHRLFAGAVSSETTEGLMMMGLSKTISLLLILFCVSVVVYLLYHYLRKYSYKEIVELTA